METKFLKMASLVGLGLKVESTLLKQFYE